MYGIHSCALLSSGPQKQKQKWIVGWKMKNWSGLTSTSFVILMEEHRSERREGMGRGSGWGRVEEVKIGYTKFHVLGMTLLHLSFLRGREKREGFLIKPALAPRRVVIYSRPRRFPAVYIFKDPLEVHGKSGGQINAAINNFFWSLMLHIWWWIVGQPCSKLDPKIPNFQPNMLTANLFFLGSSVLLWHGDCWIKNRNATLGYKNARFIILLSNVKSNHEHVNKGEKTPSTYKSKNNFFVVNDCDGSIWHRRTHKFFDSQHFSYKNVSRPRTRESSQKLHRLRYPSNV